MAVTNVAMLSAKKAVLRAVVRAVSVTQIWRAGFEVGAPVLGSLAAAALSLVPLPEASMYWGICA